MNCQDKSKGELIKELQELQQKYGSIKAILAFNTSQNH